MNGYYDNRGHKEAMQAKCRRLENTGFKIISVQYGDPKCHFQPVTPYDLSFYENNAARIQVFW